MYYAGLPLNKSVVVQVLVLNLILCVLTLVVRISTGSDTCYSELLSTRLSLIFIVLERIETLQSPSLVGPITSWSVKNTKWRLLRNKKVIWTL